VSAHHPISGEAKSRAHGEVTERTNGQILRSIVEGSVPVLEELSDADAGEKPATDRWSTKEVLGHLIDSATNNHRRFIIAYSMSDLISEGYDADVWVTLQDYQNREWSSIIGLWDRYNRHIAAVLDRLPEDIVRREHAAHNFHEMAWRLVPANTPTTLGYLIRDYIGHLEHHLRQILPKYEPVLIDPR
jgi:hypothetical protein